MWGRKKRLLAKEKKRTAELLEQLREAREEAQAWEYAAKRTAQHNEQLRERLADGVARADWQTEAAHAGQLEVRLDRALRGCARWMAALWAARRENARLRRLLHRADEDRRALAERLSVLQDANEALCREAVDRAGTLAKPEAVSVP